MTEELASADPTTDEPTPTRCVVICHTTSPEPCIRLDEPRNILLYPSAIPPTWRVQCAPCGQPITDVTPAT